MRKYLRPRISLRLADVGNFFFSNACGQIYRLRNSRCRFCAEFQVFNPRVSDERHYEHGTFPRLPPNFPRRKPRDSNRSGRERRGRRQIP